MHALSRGRNIRDFSFGEKSVGNEITLHHLKSRRTRVWAAPTDQDTALRRTRWDFSPSLSSHCACQLTFCGLSEFKDGMKKTCQCADSTVCTMYNLRILSSDQYHRQDLKMTAFVVKIIKYIREGLPHFWKSSEIFGSSHLKLSLCVGKVHA